MGRVISLLARGTGSGLRLLLYLAAFLLFLVAAAVLALRYWILPNVDAYRGDIAAAVSRAAGQPVTLGSIVASWDGLRPRLDVHDVRVFTPEGVPGLTLDHLEAVLSWRSLLVLEPRLHLLEIHGPSLLVRRAADGDLYVAGLAVAAAEGESGVGDWVLRQSGVVIRDASVVWQDDLRGAPPLALSRVSLRLARDGRWHRFGLTGIPPPELAGPFDLRGEWTGGAISRFAEWRGTLYGDLPFADLEAARTWIDLPVALERGRGALRTWVGFHGAGLESVTADVALANVTGRLGRDLPELGLVSLSGRVGWSTPDGGLEVFAEGLVARLGDGVSLPRADVALRLDPAKDGTPRRGEFRAGLLDLEALARIADRLPLDAELRRRLAELAPQGIVRDLSARWSGDFPGLASWQVKGRTENLGINAWGRLPAFGGLSGTLEGNERGGTFSVDSRDARLALPRVFRDPLEFETLTAQCRWTVRGGEVELRFGNIAFANAHAAGTVYGDYRTAADGPGTIDITGQLTRGDARVVARYMPLTVTEDVRAWVEQAFLAGESRDTRLRLKGDLAHFPFADGKQGTFQVDVNVRGVTLHYAADWPVIEGLDADVVFKGARMDIETRGGRVFGTRLGRVRASIPEMGAWVPTLQVDGTAQGPTAEFFRFVRASPVNEFTDRFTEGLSATGDGALTLRLILPLNQIDRTRVVGGFQLAANRIGFGEGLPPLERLTGRLEFTEAAVRAQGATAELLGGPVTLGAAPRPGGGTRVTLAGRLAAEQLRSLPGTEWTRMLSGATEWRAAVDLDRGRTDVVVESSLAGIGSSLPAPLAKDAAERVPLRVERTSAGGDGTWTASYGKVFAAQFRPAAGGEPYGSGAIAFGATPSLPDRPGIVVSGAVPALDLDGWVGLLAGANGKEPRAEVHADRAGLRAIDLRIGELDLFGRRTPNLYINLRAKGGGWGGALHGRDLAGEVEWKPEGRGRLTARLRHLRLPWAATGAQRQGKSVSDGALRDLPALDVQVDSLVLRENALGRAEILAVPAGVDWRLERLRVTSPEAQLNADGLWQGWTSDPRTRVGVKLDVSDIGKFFQRLGYPEGVRGGTAKLEGTVTWAGGPAALDLATLTGDFTLEAAKGRFLKIEPGIGKLLGILSLQALPRRITLDFDDIFSEGMQFDRIAATVKVKDGFATTENFAMESPAARVEMRGSVDLARETQDLKVRVAPAVSGGAALAAGTLLGGPIGGLATLVMSKVLQDPLDRLVAYDYNVTGTWIDPVVARVDRTAPPRQSDTP